MNSSQHLLVMMSIILGLGIRELLAGGRAAVAERSRQELRILPFLAGALVLIAIIQFWWYLFIVANRGVWGANFFVFAATLLRPGLLFLSAASVFPAPGSNQKLVAYYFRNRGFIYLPLAIFEGQNLVESSLNLGTLLHPAHLFHGVFILVGVALAITARETVHKVLLTMLLATVAIFIGMFSLQIE